MYYQLFNKVTFSSDGAARFVTRQ